MAKSIDKVKATLGKIRSGAQMHKLIDKINKFIKESSPAKSPKKGKDSPKKGQPPKVDKELPAKEKILAMLHSLDQVNDLTT